jgi:hypothetical protein
MLASGGRFSSQPPLNLSSELYISLDTSQLPVLALDNTNLLWSTGGDALWFGQAEVSQDGIASAESGPIVSYYNTAQQTFVGQQTWLQTVADISQTIRLSF